MLYCLTFSFFLSSFRKHTRHRPSTLVTLYKPESQSKQTFQKIQGSILRIHGFFTARVETRIETRQAGISWALAGPPFQLLHILLRFLALKDSNYQSSTVHEHSTSNWHIHEDRGNLWATTSSEPDFETSKITRRWQHPKRYRKLQYPLPLPQQ